MTHLNIFLKQKINILYFMLLADVYFSLFQLRISFNMNSKIVELEIYLSKDIF